jgi:hypothetical protein
VDATNQHEKILLQKLSEAESTIEKLRDDGHRMKAEITQVKAEKTEATNSYMDKEKELRQMIDSLTKQTTILTDEKETTIQESRKVVESLNMELGIQSRREMELKEQLNILENEGSQMRMDLEIQVRREAGLREEKQTESRKLSSENAALSENMRIKTSEMNGEMMKHITRENDLMVRVETARAEKQKLLLELDELKSDNFSSTRSSRKLIEELTKNEKELMEKVYELKLTIKTLEGKRILSDRRNRTKHSRST